ncbi:MAG: M28 family peptidase [Deltaproteobacteria bacterium]|nr:M28 family peptidase [Deltaproteobacteria bacterium]
MRPSLTVPTRRLLAALTLSCTFAASALAAPPPPRPRAPPPAESGAMARITPEQIAAHVRFLASDLLEGRKPGTRGSELAILYLATELEAMGLQPGAIVDGKPSFTQPVPMVELKAHVPATIPFWPLAADSAQAPPLALTTTGGVKAELVMNADAHVDLAKVDAAELVFVGHGIVAPEYGWDDYKDVDVRGKVVVILNFNPPFAGEFEGRKIRLWYGRWDYKYLTAAAHGAIGAFVTHTTETAGYPWQVLSASADGSRIDLVPGPDEKRMQFQGWIEQEAAKKLFALGGKSYDALVEQAAGKDGKAFKPVPLGVKSSFSMPVDRRPFESANVVGKLVGSDPKLRDEAVIYTAHHDHLGRVDRAPGPDGKVPDGIYNGAVDNASGCASVLTIANALHDAHGKRSALFLFTTAEEQGLLGSRYFARHPSVAPGKLAAGINIDSINIFGRTMDVSMLGLGKSTLDDVVRAAAAVQGRTLHGDAAPDRGGFYRSDQFELARIGVPVAAFKGGPLFEGRDPKWGVEQEEAWERRDYHQPSDEFHDQWNLEGAVQDAQLQLLVGLRVMNAPAMPQWTKNDEFEAARKKALGR